MSKKKTAVVPKKEMPVAGAVLLLIAAGFLIYANALGGAFIYDDEFLVKDNVFITNISYVKDIFKSNILAGAGQPSVFYRPLQTLALMADHAVWGLNPFGYHLTNVAWHVAGGLVLFWFLRMLLGVNAVAFLAALFFEIHPIHTEAVSYISGRADPMAFVFLILSFILYLKQVSAPRLSSYFLMLLTYAAALLSRENSMILPVLIWVYHACFKKKIRLKEFLSLVALLGLYLLVRATFLREMLSRIPGDTSLFQRGPGVFAALAGYIRLLFLPLGLHMEYGTPLFQITDLRVVGGIIALGGLLYLLFRKKSLPDAVRFSVAWFLVALLPVSNLFPINAFMAEHWLYLPSVGFFMLLALFLKYLLEDRNRRGLAVLLAGGQIIFYSFLTVRQNATWKDPEFFYARTLKYAPQSSRCLNNLGIIFKARKDFDKATDFFQRAAAAKPDNVEAPYNLGNVYAATSRMPEAIAAYERALTINPGRADILNNLGLVYLGLERNEEAIACFRKAMVLNPHYVDAASNLSVAYSNQGRKVEAIDLLKELIRKNPRYVMAHKNIAVYYYETRQYDLAVQYADKALALGAELHPAFLEALKPFRKAGVSFSKTLVIS
jgi:tetratricopeptide (TPR) repeat protein